MKFDKIDIFNTGGQPLVIAGPCSAESEEQVMQVATELKSRGVNIFRAGIWKPRTRPGCFEGVGKDGLPWLARVKSELGMYIATEVATAEHVEQALCAGVDVLWVGARTTANPFAVQEIADALRGCDIPVLVKNPVNPDIELWIGAMERLVNAGITRIGAIHRGFSSYGEKCFRNAPQWQLPIELHRRFPGLPLLCDPSHIAGKRELILSLSQQAMDLNFDGLMIETHCNPYCALSDARQQVTPDELVAILGKLVRRTVAVDGTDFQGYRRQIDEIDNELMKLLSKRMEIAREIGELKREKGMVVFQPYRYNEIMERYMKFCADARIEADAVREIFELIHSESIRQQLSVMNDNDA
ncbi:MAG: bifunctional 3-deoxy-7-phosphoheptulonate synthase/chorismate mutase type II [Bacteroidaceae bacterium]|nr:bifunctional 3-deoxy-7-phosphoheptulonate synthase/chorismate mutase type II [Bacteroidaceae bacterium]